MPAFLHGHVSAFAYFGGAPRVLLYDNSPRVVRHRSSRLPIRPHRSGARSAKTSAVGMTPTRVSDYSSLTESYLLHEDGSHANGAPALNGDGCSGMATFARVGLLTRRRVFCALFERQGEMWLRLDDKTYCLSEAAVRVVHTRLRAVRRFRLLNQSGEAAVDFWYWFFALQDPFPDSGDFFEYVKRSAATTASIAQFVCWWEARATSRGPITDNVLASVAKCVEQRIASSRNAAKGR
jgi:hypothetical protein